MFSLLAGLHNAEPGSMGQWSQAGLVNQLSWVRIQAPAKFKGIFYHIIFHFSLPVGWSDMTCDVERAVKHHSFIHTLMLMVFSIFDISVGVWIAIRH